MSSDQDNESKTPNILQVVGSVLAAGFGVQSSKNRHRDFQHGNAATFIGVGLVVTILLVLLIYSVVTLVLG
jgi:hypothetical protein